MIYRLSSFLFLLTLFSCAQTYQKDKVYQLTLLHTNDHHGRFWTNQDGEWGLAARSTMIKSIRKEVDQKDGITLLLDAGDVNTGVPQSDMLKAEPDFKGMSRLDYDAMAVGNHEFDNDLATIRQQEEWAGFPFLSANIYFEGKRLFKPYIIKEVQGLKVAILGLTTQDTPGVSKLGFESGIQFKDPIEEAKKLIPELRAQAHIVIALTHMGHYPNESHALNAPGDVTLARQVKGIDLIIGGHTQKPLFEADVQNNTIIVQAFEWGKFLGRVDLLVKNGQVTLKKYELLAVNHKDQATKVEEDQSLKAFLKPFKEKGDKTLLVNVGESNERLEGDRAVVRNQETNLGFHITEAYRRKFNADVGLTNSGGIRDSIKQGAITYETVLTVLPFSNDIVTVEMTGSELKQYLSDILSVHVPGGGSFPQTAGLEIDFDAKKKSFKKLVVANKNLDPKKIYKIALPSFIAGGGDKWPSLKHKSPKVYGFTDAAVLREYFETNRPLPIASQKKRVLVRY